MNHRQTLAFLALLLATCGPEPDDTTGDTASSTGTTTQSTPTTGDSDSSTGTTTPTTQSTPTTGDTATSAPDCGPAPPLPTCVPDQPADPRTEQCAMRSEADCDIGPNGNDALVCRWFATTTYPHDATTCESAKPGGACVAVNYFGDGCESRTTCGDETDGAVHFRTNAACEIEVFSEALCGETVLDWNTCAWATAASDSCPQPHPSAGPELCNCAC